MQKTYSHYLKSLALLPTIGSDFPGSFSSRLYLSQCCGEEEGLVVDIFLEGRNKKNVLMLLNIRKTELNNNPRLCPSSKVIEIVI